MFDENSKGKRSMLTKADITRIVRERGLADDITTSSMTKTQLIELLGGTPDRPAQLKMKLKGASLTPHSICSSASGDLLFLFDKPTCALWSVQVTNTPTSSTGAASLVVNLPQNSLAQGIASHGESLYIACPTHDGGLLHYSTSTAQLQTVARNSDNCMIMSVTVSNDKIYYTDRCGGLVYQYDPSTETHSVFSGIAQESVKLTSRDGFSTSCTHAQPGPLCMLQKTVIVCDQASTTLRLVTNIDSLMAYHKTISNIYEVFSIHSNTHGFRELCPTGQTKIKLADVTKHYQTMLEGVRAMHEAPNLKPNGPHGSLPYITMEMFNSLERNTMDLYSVVASVNLHYEVNMKSLLSIPCEHHFATMRTRFPMPTLLQYCDLLSVVIDESVKRQTVSAYHYFTNKTSYYPNPQLQTVTRYTTLRSSTINKKKGQKLTEEERKLMLNWRRDYCAGKQSFIVEHRHEWWRCVICFSSFASSSY